MKHFFITILVLVCCYMPSNCLAQIDFQEEDFETCKRTAQKEQKSFMVYISSNWCIPCKMMEETTFTSIIIQDMLNTSVTPYKINFDSETGEKWRASHNITKVPTILTFDENGNQKTRYENALTSTELMVVLDPNHPYVNKDRNTNSINPPSYIVNTAYSSPSTVEYTASTTYIESSPSSYHTNTDSEGLTLEDLNRQLRELKEASDRRRSSNQAKENSQASENTLEELNRQLRNIEISEQKKKKTIAGPTAKNTINESITSVEKIEKPRLKEKVKSTSTNKRKYEIQVGYFRNVDYAERLRSNIANQTNHEPTTTIIEKNGESFYRVTIGEFENYNIAEMVFLEVKKGGFKAYLQKVK